MRISFLSRHLFLYGLLMGVLANMVWGQSQGQQPTQQSGTQPTYRSARDENRANDAANAAQRQQSNAAYSRMQESLIRVRIMNSRIFAPVGYRNLSPATRKVQLWKGRAG